ncbi:aspartyl protease family protein [Thiosocius teredinicola]|uniref:aspartyl protease family protein n=1 Tax=Thiosocius teredinicola TaxID=1973002 RepID=UPI0009911990
MQRVFRTLSLCLLTTIAASFPALALDDFATHVAMQERSAATFYVRSQIDGLGDVDLMVDTGSGFMTINEQTLATLKAKNRVQFVRNIEGILADGSTLVVPVYLIERMSIGNSCWLDNVEAAVFPGTGRQILGLSALRKASPFVFSVDPPKLMLSQCGEVTTPPSDISPIEAAAFVSE